MLILNLANKEVVTVEFPLTHPVKGASMLGATRDGDILPLVMSCGLTPVQGQGLGKLEGERGRDFGSDEVVDRGTVWHVYPLGHV